MKELLGTRIQQRVEMLYRYTNAMECGDTDIMAVVLEEAQHDSILERMILEVNEVYQIEDRTVAHPDDVATAQEMLLTAFAEHTADAAEIVRDDNVEPEGTHLVGTGFAPVRDADRTTHDASPTRLWARGSREMLIPRDRPISTSGVGKTVRSGKWYRSRANWLMGAVAAVLIALLLLPGTGALADQFLSLFRVQQFQPVPTVERPDQLLNNVASLLHNFGTVQWNNTNSDIPVLTQKVGNNVADVDKLVDFHPQL